MNKDWSGNQNSIFTTLGASSHALEDRQIHDYYATEPKAAELLLKEEQFHKTIWECACGEGHLARVFEKAGYDVIATDLIYRGYGDPEPLDFLNETLENFEGDIITNPPYKFALEFVQKALDSVKPGRKVAMFLKLQFLEGKARKTFFSATPPSGCMLVHQGLFVRRMVNLANIQVLLLLMLGLYGKRGSRVNLQLNG